MFEQKVQKLIARDGEREIVESSQEEMQRFIVEEIRPEFKDSRVLCVKFLQEVSDDEPEESPWFINPALCNSVEGLFDSTYAYGPCMDSSFVPEILLIPFIGPNDVLRKFASFNQILQLEQETDLTDEEKLERFTEACMLMEEPVEA